MTDRDEIQTSGLVQLSSQQMEEVSGGEQLSLNYTRAIDIYSVSTQTSSDSYQGRRSTGGYVPT